MTATTQQQFQEQLNHLYALALQNGWMSFHIADALGISRRDLLRWMAGKDAPPTPEMCDHALTLICRKLELRPV